jgi:hypothetical protein
LGVRLGDGEVRLGDHCDWEKVRLGEQNLRPCINAV